MRGAEIWLEERRYCERRSGEKRTDLVREDLVREEDICERRGYLVRGEDI